MRSVVHRAGEALERCRIDSLCGALWRCSRPTGPVFRPVITLGHTGGPWRQVFNRVRGYQTVRGQNV
jgi:hypothetical protein